MTEEEDLIKTFIVFGFREITTKERTELKRPDYNLIIEFYNGMKWRLFIK